MTLRNTLTREYCSGISLMGEIRFPAWHVLLSFEIAATAEEAAIWKPLPVHAPVERVCIDEDHERKPIAVFREGRWAGVPVLLRSFRNSPLIDIENGGREAYGWRNE